MSTKRQSNLLGQCWCCMVALPFLLVACGGRSPDPVAARARGPAASEELRRGHDIHQQKCAKCHAFVDPKRYDEAAWRQRIMPEMAAKAQLDHADAQAVLAYLLAVRAQSTTP